MAMEEMKTPKVEIKMEAKPDPVTPATPARQITGRELLLSYHKGEASGITAYKKICSALQLLERWQDTAKVTFLEQLLNTAELLDDKCTELVGCLARLPWDCLPERIRPRYQELLCQIGVRHVCHTEVIYSSCLQSFLPFFTKEREESFISEDTDSDCSRLEAAEEKKPKSPFLDHDTQDIYFVMAHQIVGKLLDCYPMSLKTLEKVLKKSFPHVSTPTYRYCGFVRNVIQMGEYATKMRPVIWELIIDNLLTLDVYISNSKNEQGNTTAISQGLFAMDEDLKETKEMSEREQERAEKLDNSLRDVLDYIRLTNTPISENTLPWLRLGKPAIEEVFSIFLELLESRMLMRVHARHVTFIWLYLANLDEDYTDRVLERLWSVAVRAQLAQCDSKKAQGAVAYLSAFVARANYIDTDTAKIWLEKVAKWCANYVDQCDSGSATSLLVAGVARHGTFYAFCQALFIAFSFRYREFVKNGDIDCMRRWSIGRVVHCGLDPMRYVSRPVAQCFSAISRQVQLVYCSHVIPYYDDEAFAPFESMFPFDEFKITKSKVHISSLLRRFSPLSEDTQAITSALSVAVKTEDVNDEGAMDFLDDNDDLMQIGSFRERSGTCGVQSAFLTIYSTSPGLRQYENNSVIDMH